MSIKHFSYGRGREGNGIEINGVMTVWFSYSTPIAFEHRGNLTIRKNTFSSTTGRHLNHVDDDKSKRIDGDEFEEKLERLLLLLQG